MSSMYYFFFTVVLLSAELLYFRIARSYKILDHPNTRSLHERPTIRGGGIIFYLGAVLFYAITLRPSPLFMVSLTLVSVVGFVDDVRNLNIIVRFLVQFIAIALMCFDMDMSATSNFVIILIFIVSVGTLNTFNFMDGINGLTGGYGLVALGSLLYIDSYKIHFIESDFILTVIMALLIFCYFNFRKKAVCFAGDVGSLSIGFIVIFLIVKLITATGNYAFIFLLSVYGVDSVLTIIYRLFRKENIFTAHKLHLYQVLVNTRGISHVKMSIVYMLLQLVINVILIMCMGFQIVHQFLIGSSIAIMLGILYAFLKSQFLKDRFKIHVSQRPLS